MRVCVYVYTYFQHAKDSNNARKDDKYGDFAAVGRGCIYIHIHTYIYVYMYIYVNVYICVCVCVYVYTYF